MDEKNYELAMALNNAINKLAEARKLGDWNLVKESYFELVELENAITTNKF
jgi:hypothetical protein